MAVYEKSSKRPQMGRPPAPREEVRRNRVVTFVTDQELSYLKELAARSKTTLSRACYKLIQQQIK